jgi:hypothetical protein
MLRHLWCAIGCVGVLGLACSNGSSPASTPANSQGGKPKPAPIACAQLGAECMFTSDCAPGYVCLATPGICVPVRAFNYCADSSCPAETPLCITYTGSSGGLCVSEPELDCTCATQKGMTAVPRCQALGGARACIQPDGLCDSVPCCSGSACVAGADGTLRCAASCGKPDDCATLCCQPAASGTVGVCAAAEACCHKDGAACGTANDYCCTGYTCVTLGSGNPSSCQQDCTAHDQCATGCCAPLTGSTKSVCMPQSQCPDIFCKREGQPCGPTAGCCTGLNCASVGAAPFTCRAGCTANVDCTTQCCIPLGDSGLKACFEAQYCP